jgi:hypothetical protein
LAESNVVAGLFVSAAEFRTAFENMFQTTFALPAADLDAHVF